MITALQHEQLLQIDRLYRRGLLEQIHPTDADMLYKVMDDQPDTEHGFCRHCDQPVIRWAAGRWRHQDDRSRHCKTGLTATPRR